MLAVIRLRSAIKSRRDVADTLRMLKLKKINTLALLPENKVTTGMIKKIDNYVTWGHVSDEIARKLDGKVVGLKPAKGGLVSIKKHYPKGDLGFRGEAINDLIKRMM